MMKSKEKWFERGGFLSLFLTLITFSITVTINFVPLFSWSIQRYDLVEISGLTKETLLES